MSTICCCTPPACSTVFLRVRVCGALTSGITVTLTNGGNSFSTTSLNTGGSTNAFINVPNTGTWVWSASGGPAHVHWPGGSINVAVCGGFGVTANIDAAIDTGYTCTPDVCCTPTPTPTLPVPVITYPTTVYVNDGFGPVACTGPGGATIGWTGCALRRASTGYDCSVFNAGPGTYGAGVSNALVPVFFSVGCNTVTVDFFRCFRPAPDGTCFTWFTAGTPLPCVDPAGGCDPAATSGCGKLFFNRTDMEEYQGCSFFVLLNSPNCPPTFGGSGTAALNPSNLAVNGQTNSTHPAYLVYGSSATLSVTS